MKKKLVIHQTDTIRRKVYNHLREQILQGEYEPHERLFETRISEEIGVSRTPIREALHNLELEGLIECLPKVGYVVKPISEEEVAEICELRGLVEALAARWASEKARDKLVAELQKNIAASEKKLEQGAARAFVELDAQFHEIIARLSGSKRLLELAQTLRHHMLRYRIQSIYATCNVFRAIEGHKGILAAIKNGDKDEIELAIRTHLEQSKKDILRYALKEDENLAARKSSNQSNS
ncbi:MAG TPA: GntR family transcriptional regulator [Syntrophorhabdus sp.]|nr:GntR family transcriptional regulator [Syntrophorhabdus sp.]